MAATVTPRPRSQSVIARTPSGSAENSRVAVRAGSHNRTVAVTRILCTSRPAARG